MALVRLEGEVPVGEPGTVAALEGEVLVEGPGPQATSRDSSILSIIVSQKVVFLGMAYSLLCTHKRTRSACTHHTIFGHVVTLSMLYYRELK